MVLNIAMDGPVGAGKSSIADAVAKRLGILHLDTGAMYRAIGLTALEKGVPVQDEQAVTALCQALSMTVGHAADGQHTLVDGRDVTGFIRTPEVSMAASTVAKYAGVRAAMVALQRRLAQETPMLVDGRDIGTRVLMNAPVKIFLTASAEERARRRYQEMRNKGMDANFDDVLRDLRARDEQPFHRMLIRLFLTPSDKYAGIRAFRVVARLVIDQGIGGSDKPYIVRMCMLLIALGVIGLVCSITAQYFAAKAATGFSTRLRHELFAHIQGLSYTEMDTLGTSTLRPSKMT